MAHLSRLRWHSWLTYLTGLWRHSRLAHWARLGWHTRLTHLTRLWRHPRLLTLHLSWLWGQLLSWW